MRGFNVVPSALVLGGKSHSCTTNQFGVERAAWWRHTGAEAVNDSPVLANRRIASHRSPWIQHWGEGTVR